MKKNYISTVVLLLLTVFVRAQDTIVFKNLDIIIGVVTKVGSDEVEYKRVENPSGPSYVLAKNKLAGIIYLNRQMDAFDAIKLSEYNNQHFRNYRINNDSITASNKQKQFSMGPKIGLSFSTLTNLDASYRTNVTDIVRMQFGIAFNFANRKVYSFQPEVLYFQKGGEVKYNNNKYNYMKFNTNYFEVPAMFKFSFGGHELKGFLDIGPYLAYWASAMSIYRFGQNDTVVKESYVFDNKDDNRLDLGLCFGGGASYKVGPGKIVFDLRYDMGFLSIERDSKGTPNCNRTFGLAVIYLFNLKR